MAHWGITCSDDNPRKDAFNCIKAALMMRKEVYFFNKSRRASDPVNPIIRIGCGINSGIVPICVSKSRKLLADEM